MDIIPFHSSVGNNCSETKTGETVEMRRWPEINGDISPVID